MCFHLKMEGKHRGISIHLISEKIIHIRHLKSLIFHYGQTENNVFRCPGTQPHQQILPY